MNRDKKVLINILIMMLLPVTSLFAQKYSVSTNLLQYANLITFNGEVSMSVSRHVSSNMGFRYNPFLYGKSSERYFTNRQRTFNVGINYWPWHIYSGWWFGTRLQYQEYNSGGILSKKTREGDRYGLTASAGYSYMLTPRLNIDFGIGVFGGYDVYRIYACPVCGVTEKEGKKMFVRPDEVILGLSIIF